MALQHPPVRVTTVDDPTIVWGRGQEGCSVYTKAIARAEPRAILANASFSLAALQLKDRAFPLIAADGGSCWLTSLAVTYGQAARDEIPREVRGAKAVAFGALSYGAEGFLRILRATRCVFANHLLFSTSLYGDWTGDDLPEAIGALRDTYPDRAIVWRSLNQHDNPKLVQRMLELGGRQLLSRIVWRIPDPAQDWAPRRDVRDDRKLLATTGMHIEAVRSLSSEDTQRVLSLYRGLYREKYSRTNPDYGAAILHAAIESGVLVIKLIRNDSGVIEAFVAEHAYHGVLTNPMLGYDRALPQSRGLYRMAMAVSGERAIAEDLAINFSAGAAAFKRNRGARPAIEFSIIFDRHLPPWRRMAYPGLASALDAMAPSLERIALQ
jgi:hypothetical protein